MKELTYRDWIKNPIPRMMWVWDSNENNKVQRKVIYIIDKPITYQVIALIKSELSTESFMHCAEIEEQKTRRMTNKELSRWLRENPTRECTHRNDSDDRLIYSIHTYLEICANEEVDDCILIREDGGEWREPLVEVEE